MPTLTPTSTSTLRPMSRHSERSLRSAESPFDPRVLSRPAANPVIPTGEPRSLRLAVEGSWQARHSTRLDVTRQSHRPATRPRSTH